MTVRKNLAIPANTGMAHLFRCAGGCRLGDDGHRSMVEAVSVDGRSLVAELPQDFDDAST
jgi:hypothetical protein